MFCNKCGKQLADGLKFCTGCGASVEALNTNATPTEEMPQANAASKHPEPQAQAPIMQTPNQPSSTEAPKAPPAQPQQSPPPQQPPQQQAYQPPSFQQQAYQSQQTYGQQPVYADSLDGAARRKTTVAVSIILSMLTIICMLLSGVKLEMSLEDVIDIDVQSKSTLSVFEIRKTVSGFKSLMKQGLDEMRSSGFEYRNAKSFYNKLQIVNFVLIVECVLCIAAVIALMVAAYMMMTTNKNGAMVAQAASTATFLFVILFLISMFVLKTSFNDLMSDMGVSDYYDFGKYITISLSGWLYLSAIISALNFVFITVRKNVIRGE